MEVNLFYNLRIQSRDPSIFDLADNGAEQSIRGGEEAVFKSSTVV